MKSRIITSVWIMLLVCYFNNSLAQNIHYVASDGDNVNPGTIDQPWKTIQHAVDQLQPRNVLYIKAGTYPEEIIMTTSGTADKPILISNFEEDRVIIDATNKSFGISLRECHYVTIQGLHILGATKSWSKDQGNLHLYGNPSHITIQDCELYNGTRGIRYSDRDFKPAPYYIQILNCDIHDNTQEGIYLNSTQHGAHQLIRGNKIYNNGHDFYLTEYGDKIRYDGLYFRSDSSLIEDNEVYNNGRNGMYLDVTSARPCRYNIVRRNNIYHNGKNGMMFCQHYTLIYENKIYDNGWDFTNAAMHGIYMANATHNIIFNNEMYEHRNGSAVRVEGDFSVIQDNNFYNNGVGMYGCDSYGTSYGNILRNNRMYANFQRYEGAIPGSGLEISGPKEIRIYHNIVVDMQGFGCAVVTGKRYVSTGAKLKNNIFMNCEWSTLWVKEGSDEGFLEAHNVFFPDRSDAIRYKDEYYDFPTYQNEIGQGKNSFAKAPLFIDRSNYNFHLAPQSPCIEAGDFLTRTTAAGSGTQIPVEDVMYFCDGYGIIDGDLIQLEGTTQTVRIVKIEYDNNLLQVDQAISWTSGQGVSRPYEGTKPDIGVFESSFENDLSATLQLSANSPIKAGEVSVQLTTNRPVIQVPTPLLFQESDGTTSEIPLSGAAPGNTFTGIFKVDQTVANGKGHFYLNDGALVDETGNINQKIVPEVEVTIDQQAPASPVNIIVSR